MSLWIDVSDSEKGYWLEKLNVEGTRKFHAWRTVMDQIAHLFSACEHGDAAEVDIILTSGVAVDTVIDGGFTPLQMAAANGQEQVVRLLLRKGASLDKTNEFGWTAIMQAARYNQLKIIALLLQNNADLHSKNKLFASALNMAARAGHLSTVSLLVESGIDLNGNGTHCENTPLMSAAQYGHDAVVRYLLDRGCDVNYRNPNTGLNALMLSALNGHMTTAQILVERGADPNLTNANEQTALDIAIARRKREVRAYLDRKTTKRPHVEPEEVKSDIIEATRLGDLGRIKEILDEDPDERDAVSPEDGATPLMLAAINGRLDIVQLLVDRQCDVDKRDRISGWTALMQATFHGKKNVAVYLVNIGADVSIQANNGCTAFEMASLIDDVDTELLRLLAAKRVQTPKSEKKRWCSRSGQPAANPPENLDEVPRGSLKLWWKRTSNRFRNLKLGRTFMFSSGRLSPIIHDSNSGLSTLRSKLMGSTTSMPDITRTNSAITGIGTYETLLLSEAPTLSFGLTSHRSTSALSGTDTLKPVIPPFPPPATFEIADGLQRKPKKPYKTRFALDDDESDDHMTNHKRSVKLFSTAYNTSPNNSHGGSGSSPGSSGGASAVHTTFQRINKIPKSADTRYKRRVQISYDSAPSSAPFRAHAPTEPVFEAAANFRQARSTTPNNKHPMTPARLITGAIPDSDSPNSSMSSGSGQTNTYHVRSSSSTVSNTSTLTPSPSPGPLMEEYGDQRNDDAFTDAAADAIIGTVNKLHETEDDELMNVLKRLSLEKYQPIFEEQEVDMEAFLTLTDQDLKELGITRREPRRKILSAIDEITSGRSSSSDLEAGATTDGRTKSESNLVSTSKSRRAWEEAG